jgi:hypothetical protein
MPGLFPNAPQFSTTETDITPAREWVMPAFLPVRHYAQKICVLPPGMPDYLEVHVVQSDEGIERTTAVIYGKRAYLVHYEFKKTA